MVAASDIHPNAELTHDHRFREQLGLNYSFIRGNIRSASVLQALLGTVRQLTRRSTIDVVVGGPPCQGFSIFGLRRQDDPRNDLFRPYLRVIEELKPRYFVMENVPGLELMYGGQIVELIYAEVSRMTPTRYRLVGPLSINAAEFGVPQLRKRILFIGHREDMEPIVGIPSDHAGPYVTVKEAIDDLAFLRSWERDGSYHNEYPANTEYQRESRRGRLFRKLGIERTDNELKNHEAANHTPSVIARFAMIEPGKGFESIPVALWEKYLYSSKRWCIRLLPDYPSNTVLTLPDDLVHYERHRILTVREAARLQSFDDTFIFLGPRATGGGGKGNKKRSVELPQYSQVGNAIPPLLAKGIGETLLTALEAQTGSGGVL